MDMHQKSQLVGAYFRQLAERNANRATYAMRFGHGKPVVDMFSKERIRTRIALPFQAMAAAISRRGLDSDAEFLACLADAVEEVARAPIENLLWDLQTSEKHGDGGPDPAFFLQFTSNDSVNASVAHLIFQAESDSETRRRILINWPRNQNHLGACMCCGYFTLVDPPASRELCPVCYWEDKCDLDDPWSMSKWGAMPGEDKFWTEVLQEDYEPRLSIDDARKNYERIGASAPRYVEHVRSATIHEQPRYNWSSDTRPQRSEGNPT